MTNGTLRLIDQKRVRWKNRAHFFGVAAQLMRRILVDHARARHADIRFRQSIRGLAVHGAELILHRPCTSRSRPPAGGAAADQP